MQHLFPVPSCFSSSTSLLFAADDIAGAAKLGQNLLVLTYRAKTADHFTLITITWCRNHLTRSFSISTNGDNHTNTFKVEMRPWRFCQRHGTKRFTMEENKPIDIIWDLRNAKFCNEDHSSPQPLSDYYIAVVSDNEIVLLIGDLKMEACRKTESPLAAIEAMLVSKKDHIFGKKRFLTRGKFDEKGKFYDVCIECDMEAEMVVKIDGMEVIHVRHLEWKFRGNEMISLSKVKVEVYWDVHGWLFNGGLRYALFIFKPMMKLPSSTSSSSSVSLRSLMRENGGSSYSDFCLFLHAWKVE